MPDAPENKNLMPMVTASAVTLAGAITTIVTYALQQITGQNLPETVDEAILIVVTAICAFACHRLST